jgi:S-adenosylmethionine hydrolase
MAVPIALVTDFGLDDWYVGVMKAVVLSISPDAQIIDLAHSIPPHDVEAAGFVLLVSSTYLPGSTVVVVVVDPGVGGGRRILCARSGGHTYVFPDNGVLTELLDRDGVEAMVEVKRPEFFMPRPSHTFHGRDVFAPVAAHLSLGVEIEELGPAARGWTRAEIAGPRFQGERVLARVRWIDRFGNLVTDCPVRMVAEARGKWGEVVVEVPGGATGPVVPTYGAAERGCLLGVVGSSGYLEISVREGNAAGRLGLRLGDTVVLRGSEGPPARQAGS